MHLTAAYDLLIAATVAGVLALLRRAQLRLGTRTLLLAILYGAGRLAFDFLREDAQRFGLTGSQWTALAVIAIAAGLLAYRRRLVLPREATASPRHMEAEGLEEQSSRR